MARKLTKRQRESRRKRNSARTTRLWERLREKHEGIAQWWARWTFSDPTTTDKGEKE